MAWTRSTVANRRHECTFNDAHVATLGHASRGPCRVAAHRVTGGGRPPPVPTERGMRLSRTTLFGTWFTALRAPAASRMGGAVWAAATVSVA